jgi:hypothetical protein
MTVVVNGSGSITGVPEIGGPAFLAYQTVAQSLPNGSFTKLICNVEEFDTAGAYDAATGRFQPAVAGYYHFNGNMQVASPTQVLVALFKNGADYIRGVFSNNTTTIYSSVVGGTIYLNGSTDYVELHGLQGSGAALSTVVAVRSCVTFSGHLVRAA